MIIDPKIQANRYKHLHGIPESLLHIQKQQEDQWFIHHNISSTSSVSVVFPEATGRGPVMVLAGTEHT